MLERFTTKQLVFIALMGALMFVLSFIFGSALNVLINPAASGFISALIQPIMIVISLLVLRKFGTTTLMYLIFGILAIPTNMLGGLPGPFKILVALVMGLTPDIISRIGKYKKGAVLLGFLAMYITVIPLQLYLWILLGIPGADKFIAAAPFLVGIFLIEGLIGWYVGIKIYNKIKNKKIIRQFSR